VTSDGYSKTVEFVEPDLIHGARFAIAQDNGFADKLSKSFAKLGNNGRRSRLCSWHEISPTCA
jgi:hypothetical protein